jgi:two-component system OmpR family response regulator
MQRILLVCNDLVMTDELTLFLQDSGFQVASIIESKQAVVEMVRTHPDLILVRENNRRVNGDELCIHIRELSDVPIIVLGHALEQADGVEMLEMGADAYLTSPLNPRELLARINRLLRRTRQLWEK